MDRSVRSMYMDIVERRALDDNLYRVTIAANEEVRQPPALDFEGLSTENYAKNPVVMWAHDVEGRSPSGGLPIGRTLNLKKGSDGKIVADFEFLSDDQFSQRIRNAWDKGFLQAASISWLPVESTPGDGGRWRDTRSELLEWSIVSVPADPDALRRASRRMMANVHRNRVDQREAQPGIHPHPHLKEGVIGPGAVGPDRQLTLSRDDYDDLTEALSLLREVIEELEVRHGRYPDVGGLHRPTSASGQKAPEVITQNELAEIRGNVEKVLATVYQHEEVS